ncbi:MAG: twin-arginine translocase TatA/TatE family subunit [Acidimicrobiaceae bacterium]|nr:twin-arginine translocase TatA/TatE family subunit [Acidimicrobiaceae bacterium]
MLNFSPEKLLLVGLIALIVVGPHRLPEAARAIGRFLATVRRMSSGVQAEMRDALAEPKGAIDAAMGEFRPPDLRRSVREAIGSTLSPPAPSVSAPPDREASQPAQPTEPPDSSPSLDGPDDPSLN